MKIRVGCCGFPVSREKYYQNFDLVEIQKTFYQPPREKTAEKWRQEAPVNFEFTLKAWQMITHPTSSPTYRRVKTVIPESKKRNYGFLKPTDEVWAAWEVTGKMVEILKARIVVFQCPAGFKPTRENKKNLRSFFNTIKRKRYLFVWEPRGKWDRREISTLCEKLNLIPCVDPFKNRSFPGRIAYFRLHGKTGYRYQYTNSDLKELKSFSESFDSSYFMFNNVYMFEDAIRFKEIIG
jgi:uncharacterized protein YecE (DUF72 family)